MEECKLETLPASSISVLCPNFRLVPNTCAYLLDARVVWNNVRRLESILKSVDICLGSSVTCSRMKEQWSKGFMEGGRGMKTACLCPNRKKRGRSSTRLLGAEHGVELPMGLLKFDVLRPAAFHTSATAHGWNINGGSDLFLGVVWDLPPPCAYF